MSNQTGDIQIIQDEYGDMDMSFPDDNAQPLMTNGLETYVYFAVFGEDNWQNAIVRTDPERMDSGFPEVIKRNVVTEKTKNDGIKAIEKALSGMVKDKIARRVSVIGEIKTNNRIDWQIDIERLNDSNERYYINWEKSSLNPYFERVL